MSQDHQRGTKKEEATLCKPTRLLKKKKILSLFRIPLNTGISCVSVPVCFINGYLLYDLLSYVNYKAEVLQSFDSCLGMLGRILKGSVNKAYLLCSFTAIFPFLAYCMRAELQFNSCC